MHASTSSSTEADCSEVVGSILTLHPCVVFPLFLSEWNELPEDKRMNKSAKQNAKMEEWMLWMSEVNVSFFCLMMHSVIID